MRKTNVVQLYNALDAFNKMNYWINLFDFVNHKHSFNYIKDNLNDEEFIYITEADLFGAIKLFNGELVIATNVEPDLFIQVLVNFEIEYEEIYPQDIESPLNTRFYKILCSTKELEKLYDEIQ